MRNLNCDGDYKLQEEWLEKHCNAAQIVYDSVEDLPAFAIYINPIYRAYVDDVKNFYRKIKELMNR